MPERDRRDANGGKPRGREEGRRGRSPEKRMQISILKKGGPGFLKKDPTRVFAGETAAQALEREAAGFTQERPEQVRVSQGGTRGEATVGITGTTRPRNRQTRGGLAIN